MFLIPFQQLNLNLINKKINQTNQKPIYKAVKKSLTGVITFQFYKVYNFTSILIIEPPSISMRKPFLKTHSYNFSTPVFDLPQTRTPQTNFSPLSASTTANVIHSTVSPISIEPPLNDKPSVNFKNETTKKKANQSQIHWTNTKDIQAIIARTIETDIEQSIERNFGTQRYVFSGERVCAEKELPIPQEVKKEIMNEANNRPNQKKVQVHYGYLSYANAVYYIIGQDLYVFRIEDLKKRTQKDSVGDEISNCQPLMPVKLKKILNHNCRKIHEINFSDDLKGFPSLNILSKRTLMLEYPYHLEIVNYEFLQIPSNSNNPEEGKKTVFSIISLGMLFKIGSERTDFITITPANTFLYIDENGLLVNWIIQKSKGRFETIQKKQTFIEHKRIFLSKCKGIMRNAKKLAFEILPFSISFQLSKRKNLALVYDEKRSRVFTLTLKGDRSTIIQKIQKKIKVYEFVPTQAGPMNCIWEIPEEQILRELGYPVDPSKVFVENILKADPDYHQEASIIILLSNGIKSYLEIGNQSCKIRWNCHPPQAASLKQAVDRKNNSLFEMANLNPREYSNSNIMMNIWSKKIDVDSSKNNQQVSFSYFNDRSISIGLVRSNQRMGMYLTVRKNYQKSDFYDIFDVKFNNEFFKKRLNSFPTENSIFQNKCTTFRVENSLRVGQLEQYETIKQPMSSTNYTHPNPTTEGSHELLRQVHHGPRHFTYLSNHFISTFVLVRPVDIVYYFVKFQRDIFCQNYLSSIISVNLSEISCMLLQIYTAPQGTSYFVPKNYMQNIEDILKEMQSNTKEVDIYASINLQSTFLNKNKKRLESYRKQNYDQLIEFKKGANDALLRTNIRSLFASFCIQQKLSNHDVFYNLQLQSIKKSSEEIDFETNVKKLSQQHKVQAKNCLVYISRVLYPFWNAKRLTVKKGQVYIQTIKNKVQELDDIVILLKIQGNDYWHHLGCFLQKIHQIIEIFIWIQKIPQGLTLSEAMQKNLQYFEPFIFETLQQNYQPNFIQKFKQLFPLYITTEFETLIKIHKIIAKSKKENEIRNHLQVLSSYPQYFIEYLKRQKPFINHAALIVRDDPYPYQNEDIEMSFMLFPTYQQLDYQESEFIQDMKRKLEGLKAFIQTLRLHKYTPIDKEIMQYLKLDPEEFNGIDSNVIVKQVVKCIQKMKMARKLKKLWSGNDVKILIWVICKYSDQQQISIYDVQTHDNLWKFVSSVIPGTTPRSCLFKWLSLHKNKLSLHSWKPEEQKLLMELQKKYTNAKNKWKLISEELYLENQDKDKIFRHPKQCREHYASFLDSNIVKGPWSKNEDNILLIYIALNIGEKKWCKLTRVLEGRTQNAIKNRYQLLFSKLKEKEENKSKSEYEIIVEYLKENDPDFEIKMQRAQAAKNADLEKNCFLTYN